MEDITDADYTPAKRCGKDFEIKHLGDYHVLWLRSGNKHDSEFTYYVKLFASKITNKNIYYICEHNSIQ